MKRFTKQVGRGFSALDRVVDVARRDNSEWAASVWHVDFAGNFIKQPEDGVRNFEGEREAIQFANEMTGGAR